MTFTRRFLSAVGATCFSLVLLPADAQAPGKGVNVMTRLLMEIGPLERTLAAAPDRAVAEPLLDTLFLERKADGIGTARDDWLARKAEVAKVDGIAVHELGDVALAEFHLLDAKGHETYVVDAWRRNAEGKWQLRLRLLAPLKGAAH
jgi:hypothetical protein